MIAVAVFDYGDAPPGYFDRRFRFHYLEQPIRQNGCLSAFAYRADDIPAAMTRLRAVGRPDCPTGRGTRGCDGHGPSGDPWCGAGPTGAQRQQVLVADHGSFHTLVFSLGSSGIEGVFEHHTGEVTRELLGDLIAALARGR